MTGSTEFYARDLQTVMTMFSVHYYKFKSDLHSLFLHTRKQENTCFCDTSTGNDPTYGQLQQEYG